MRVEPFSCLRPAPARAGDWAAPPYDVFDDAQARAYVATHLRSFLSIDRPETSFPVGVDVSASTAYARAAELMAAAQSDGTLVRDELACLYVYRLEDAGHVQTGVAAAVSVDDYLDCTVRRHEATLPDKVRDRVGHILAVGAQTGPVLLAHEDDPTVDALVGEAGAAAPLYDFADHAGVRHTLWRVSCREGIEALCSAFAHLPRAYIADGHHRGAAAVEICLHRRAAGDATGASDAFLCLLVPASQLGVRAYERVVADADGRTEEELLVALRAAGLSVGEPEATAVSPASRGTFGLYAFGRWRRLGVPEETRPADPVRALDVSLLQERVLAPILDVEDPATSPRIRFVSAIEGTARLEELAGSRSVAFTLHPTSVAELMAVADAGELMPPKSTWFAPKPASGLLIRRI